MNNELAVVLTAVPFAFFITLPVRKYVLEMIEQAGFVCSNYEGKQIPAAAGIVFPVSVLIALIPFYFIFPGIQFQAVTFMFLVTFSVFLGFVDDLLGNREFSGLKGHLKVLLKGRMTTGGFKAVFGGLLSITVAAISGPAVYIPLNALLIALSMNAVNLLDLRPGRAAKVFITAVLLLGIAGWGEKALFLPAIVLGSVLAFLPLDLKARAMMGDSGANALGATLGIMCVWFLDLPLKGGVLILLLLFHVFTEKYSLTRVIAQNRVLNFLDMLGRKK